MIKNIFNLQINLTHFINKFSFLFILLYSSLNLANVLGDFQTFVPNTDGLFFITVDSGQTLKKHTIVGNAYLSYTKDYLYVTDGLSTQKKINYKDSGLFLDGTIGVSLSDNLQVFTGVTQLIQYTADSSNSTQYALSQGVHSFRPGIKYKFFDNKNSQIAVLASVDLLNVRNDPYTGENPSSITNLSLAYSTKFSSKAQHGFNLGYRNRNPGATSTDATFYPLKSQIIYSYGYSQPISDKTRFVFETIGCLPVNKGDNKNVSELQCLEVLGAARYRHNKYFAFVGGGTFEPLKEKLGPTYRVFAGVNAYLYPNSDTQEMQQIQEADPLNVPDTLITYPNKNLVIPIRGGKGPYTCQFKENSPEAVLEDCVYSTPNLKDSALIEVSDSFGQTLFTQVIVKPKIKKVSPAPIVKAKPKPIEEPINLPIYENVQTIKETKITIKNVNFVFNTTKLVSVSKNNLNETINKLKKLKINSIVIEGHTDNIGSEEYNQLLSEERAQAISEILSEELNLNADKINIIGHGYSQPVNTKTDEKSRLENRRVEITVYYQE